MNSTNQFQQPLQQPSQKHAKGARNHSPASIYYAMSPSPLGPVLITASEQGIHHILFDDMPEALGLLAQPERVIENPTHPLIVQTRQQLKEYFAGDRQQFDLPLAARGTPFQQGVWQQLCRIPYSVTWNYGELAHALGRPTAARAVGMANGRNPLSIVVPCHRVIGKNRHLTGYAGGLERKAWLLEHEQSYSNRHQT